MPVSSPHRIILPVALAILSVVAVLFLAPVPSYEPHGIVLPTQYAHSPTDPDNIVVYTSVPDSNYEILGVVRVQQYYDQRNDEAKEQILRLSKELASQVGANGVLLIALFPTPLTSENESQIVYNLRALAILKGERPLDFNRGQEL